MKEILNVKSYRHTLSIYFLICTSLLIALLPVILSDNYLRQDDLTFDAWPGMRWKQLGFLYYNGVYQVVRPIGAFFNYATFMLSINMHNAVYIRLASIILITLNAILIYQWQLKFNTSKILAACFAISAFTLPAYQIFAATANYICIIFAISLAIIAMFCWHQGYISDKHQKAYRLAGHILFFASLLDYPLLSMFAFTLLAIAYLNLSQSQAERRFIFTSLRTILLMMVAYFILIKLVHLVFHVNLQDGRVASINTNGLLDRLQFFMQFVGLNTHLWLYNPAYENYANPGIALVLVILALAARKRIFTIPCGIFILILLAYSPALTQPTFYTFRYTLATMPIILYCIFWSINIIFPVNLLRNTLLTIITLFGIIWSNLMLADGIVGPHENDFNFIQQQIAEKALPLLQQNKPVIIHMVDYDGKKGFVYGANIPTSIEYALRIPHLHIMVMEALSHSLTKLGYSSNFNREIKTQVDSKNFIVTAPWGFMVINNDANYIPFSTTAKIITIDFKDAKVYEQFDFYRKKSWYSLN